MQIKYALQTIRKYVEWTQDNIKYSTPVFGTGLGRCAMNFSPQTVTFVSIGKFAQSSLKEIICCEAYLAKNYEFTSSLLTLSGNLELRRTSQISESNNFILQVKKLRKRGLS